jgi:hypothetical protein
VFQHEKIITKEPDLAGYSPSVVAPCPTIGSITGMASAGGGLRKLYLPSSSLFMCINPVLIAE